MVAKTRLITIYRSIWVEQPKKDGKTEMVKVTKAFPCRVNAGTPFDHRMCQ